MSDSRHQPAIALVVKLGRTSDSGTITRLASRLASDQLSATWGITGVGQLHFVEKVNPEQREIAIDIATVGDVEQVAQRLEMIKASTTEFSSVLTTEAQLRRCVNLANQTGITSALVEDTKTHSPRQAGPNLWKFSAGLEVPTAPNWPRLFSASANRKLDVLRSSGAAVVKLDVEKMTASSQGGRQVDRLLTKLAWAKKEDVRVATLSELAAIHAERTAVRPQKSILRAA